MRLFASSRRLVILLIIAVATALLPVATRLTIAFPDIIGGGGGSVLPLAAIAPMILAVAIAWAFTARRSHLSAAALRRTEIGDVAVLIATDLLILGISTLIPQGDLTAARNAAMLAGISALITCLAGPAAGGASVTIFVLLVLTYGRTAPGAGLVRVLQSPPDAAWPLGLTMALTVAACSALYWVRPQISLRRP